MTDRFASGARPSRPTQRAETSLPINSVDAANEIAFAPGAPYVAIAFDAEVDVWNVSTRAFVARRPSVAISGVTSLPQVVSVAFSASGNALFAGEQYCGKVAFCSYYLAFELNVRLRGTSVGTAVRSSRSRWAVAGVGATSRAVRSRAVSSRPRRRSAGSNRFA